MESYIALALLFIVSCQSKSIVENEQNLHTYDVLDSTIVIPSTTNNRTLDDSKNLITKTETIYNNELAFYKENYEREQSLRKIIFNDYRYAINEISPSLDSETAEKVICAVDNSVINAIKDRDFSELAKCIHPIKGVRISCFNESSTTDVVLSRDNLLLTEKLNEEYLWGTEWGKDEIITMSVKELFDTLLYKMNYMQYTPIYNPNKLRDYADGNEYIFYDKCISVLYLYEGNEASDWLDWSGLKLIYQEHLEGNWYLTGIIHCERIM